MENNMYIKSNKGILVPFFSVDREYFRNEFIIDKDKYDEKHVLFRNAFNWIRHNYTSYHLFNEYFDDSITLYGNENNLTGTITFNYNEFLIKIRDYLNMNFLIPIDDPTFKTHAQHRINTLKKIQTEEGLRKEFPKLYEIFVSANNPFNDVDTNYYYNCGIRYVPSYFAHEQSIYFEHVLRNLDNIIEEYPHYTIVKNAIKDNYNRDKLRLYTAYRLFSYYIDENTKDIIPNLDITLKNYFDDVRDIGDVNTTVTLENGDTISYIGLLSDYNKHVTGGAIETWTIAPSGHDKTKKFHPPINHTAMSDEEYERLYALNKEKYDYYEGLNYLARARGKYINAGYYAFFLPNGEQLLDKLCYPDEPFAVSHYANAIFNLNIHNFELLSHIDKTTLRKSGLCPYTTHRGNWQERANDMINKTPTTNDTIEKSLALIKRIEIK